MSTFEIVRQALIDEAKVPAEKITIGTSLVEDLSLDSLDMVGVQIKLESVLDRRLDDEAFIRCATISDIVALIDRVP